MTLLVALLGEALADTITLESGAALEGTLTHYEIHGTCNIHVEEGGLAGANVVLPCAQVIRMERQAVAQSAPTTLDGSLIIVPDEQSLVGEVAPVEELAPPLLELAPMTVAEDAAGANVGVEPDSMVLVPMATGEVASADVGVEPQAAPEEPPPPASTPEEETPVAAVSPEEQAAPKEERSSLHVRRAHRGRVRGAIEEGHAALYRKEAA